MSRLIVVKGLKILALTSVASILIGCTGGGRSTDDHWGIDNTKEIAVTHGPLESNGLYRCTKNDATLVKPGGIVHPVTKGTKLRLWHYKNSKEYVCVLKGKAVIR